MRSARAREGHGWLTPFAAQMLLELAVQCQGNKSHVDIKSARITLSGDNEELQVYSVNRARQVYHALNPALYSPYTYPNFLGVDVPEFSRYALMTCYSVPLSPSECVANAEKQRDKLAERTQQQMSELRRAIQTDELSEEDRADLVSQIDGLEKSINNQLKTYEHFDPDNVKLAFRLVRYYIDVHNIMKVVEMKKDWIREQLDKRIIETMGESLDEDDEVETSKRISDLTFCARWRLPTLIDLGLVRAEPELLQPTASVEQPKPKQIGFTRALTSPTELWKRIKQWLQRKEPSDNGSVDEEQPAPSVVAEDSGEPIYVRYDFQGLPKNARFKVPQFNIYKIWNSMTNYQLMSQDAQGVVTMERAMKMRDEWLKQINLLIATVSFGVWRLDPPTWRAMLRRPAYVQLDEETTKRFLDKTVNIECSTQLPDINWQRPAASLIRQDRASEDASSELKKQVDPELEKAKKRKAEEEGDPNAKPAEDE